jgi:hypothetical protein
LNRKEDKAEKKSKLTAPTLNALGVTTAGVVEALTRLTEAQYLPTTTAYSSSRPSLPSLQKADPDVAQRMKLVGEMPGRGGGTVRQADSCRKRANCFSAGWAVVLVSLERVPKSGNRFSEKTRAKTEA